MAVVVPVDTKLPPVFGWEASAVLTQIGYWLTTANGGVNRHVVRKFGAAWFVKRRDAFATELGFNPTKLRRTLETLKDCGAIVIEQHKHNDEVLGFIRIDQAVVNKLVEAGERVQNTRRRTNPEKSKWTGPIGNVQVDFSGSVTVDLSIICETSVKTEGDLGLATPTGSAEGNQQPEETTVGSVADSMAGKLKNTPIKQDPSKAKSTGQLAQTFREAWAEINASQYLPSFHAKALGQLKQVAARSGVEQPGLMIRWAVLNWQEFVNRAVADQSAFNTPALPDLGFMLRYVQSLSNSYRDSKPVVSKVAEKKKLTIATPKAKPVTAPVQSTAPEEAIADADEIAKLMGYD